MKTAFTASKLAIAVFIVPYVFCFNPSMLLIDTTAVSVVQIFITSLIGVFGVSVTGRISVYEDACNCPRYAGCRRTDAYQSNAFDGYFGTASDRCRMCMAENAAE